MQSDQMSIGEFARHSRLSPKALPLYDELGLLEPTRVDDDSGYRYYSCEVNDDSDGACRCGARRPPIRSPRFGLDCRTPFPSSSGMRMSISTTSGASWRVIATASGPFVASPTTSMSGSEPRIMRKPPWRGRARRVLMPQSTDARVRCAPPAAP